MMLRHKFGITFSTPLLLLSSSSLLSMCTTEVDDLQLLLPQLFKQIVSISSLVHKTSISKSIGVFPRNCSLTNQPYGKQRQPCSRNLSKTFLIVIQKSLFFNFL